MPKEQKRRRGRTNVLLGFFVALALIIAFLLTSGLFFKIKVIEVKGVTVYTSQEIIDLTGYSYGDNIFLINKNNAKKNIQANLPYAKNVRTYRRLPSTLVVEVTEAAPAGMIEYRGSYWLFDTQGTLLESVAILTGPELPVVKGVTILAPLSGDELYFPEEEKVKREPMLDLLKALLAAGLWKDVREVDVGQLSNMRFLYRGIYRVEVGTPELLERKLKTMVEALDRITDAGPGILYLSPVAEDKPAYFVPGD